MKGSVMALLLVILGYLVVSQPVFTHHSNAVVDKDKLYTVTGDVTRFAFVNPHVAIYWKGQNQKGEIIEWYASAAPPVTYTRLGWNNKMFKAGEKVMIQGHPMRDGTPLMQFQAIYRCATGEQVRVDAGNEDEYRTRVKMVKLSAERVKAICADGKLIEGVIENTGGTR